MSLLSRKSMYTRYFHITFGISSVEDTEMEKEGGGGGLRKNELSAGFENHHDFQTKANKKTIFKFK